MTVGEIILEVNVVKLMGFRLLGLDKTRVMMCCGGGGGGNQNCKFHYPWGGGFFGGHGYISRGVKIYYFLKNIPLYC